MKSILRLVTCSLGLLTWLSILAFTPVQPQASGDSVVHAVLFYSPTCGHCEYVITEVLPPLFDQYDEQLQMIGIDVTTPAGTDLFHAAWAYFGLEKAGVPFLVLGDRLLIGSVDIPEQFPGLIEMYLSQGGVDWPAIPGLQEALQDSEQAQTPAASPTAPHPPTPVLLPSAQPTPSLPAPVFTPTPGILLPPSTPVTLGERLGRDPLANGLAILVLLGMLVVLGISIFRFRRLPVQAPASRLTWLFPLLCVLGLGVAGYLATVEIFNVEAVCGPVGDCNAVQQSAYARLFGILPIGLLGLAGYLVLLGAWSTWRFTHGLPADLAALVMLLGTSAGLLFSIYLTFLEPFVIGATCAWCLASAIITTLLFLLSLQPGRQALAALLSRLQPIQPT